MIVGLVITLIILAILATPIVWAIKRIIRKGKEVKRTWEE